MKDHEAYGSLLLLLLVRLLWDNQKDMAILSIVQYPDPVLSRKSDLIAEIQSDPIQTLIEDMIATLHSVPGIGLAAPQVGQSLRLFIFDLSLQEEAIYPYLGPQVVIHPEILEMHGEDRSDEGCLSISGYRENVCRPAFVRLKGLDRTGTEKEWEGEGLIARLFQHEVDHLNGILMVNRISSLKKDIFYRKWKKQKI